MASMRYVRDKSNRAEAQPNSSHQIRSSNGKNRTYHERASHRGRFFSGRGRGRGRIVSSSFARPAISKPHGEIVGNKWVRASGNTPLETSVACDLGESSGLSLELGSTLSGTQRTEVAGPNDHAAIESSIDHSSERNNLLTSKNFEKRGKNKLVLNNDESINLESTGNITAKQNSVFINEEPVAAIYHAKMDFVSETREANNHSNSIALKKLGKNKLVLQKDDSVNLESKNHDNNKEIQKSGQFHVISNERMEHKGHVAELVSKYNKVGEVSDPSSTGDTIDGNRLLTRNKSSLTWSRESATQQVSSTDNRKSYGDGRIAIKRKPPNTHYDPLLKGSRRICLNTTLPTTEPSACGLPREEFKTESEKSSEQNPSVKSTIKKFTDYCYRDTGRGRGDASIAGRQHIISGRSARKRNMGLVRVKPDHPSATAICPTFRRGLPCNNPKCTLRHDVSSEASRPICVFFQRNGMCSKGSACLFRHVKVRWDAEVCPMFEKLGYCEDPDCVMRHVVAKKASQGKDGSRSKSFSQH